MAMFIQIFCALFFISKMNSATCRVLRIDRDILDKNYNSSECHYSTRIENKCVCKNNLATIMSKNGYTYSCGSPYEIGCDNSLLASKQTFLLANSSATKKIFGAVNDTTFWVHSISIWNLRKCKRKELCGRWDDITSLVPHHFSTQSNSTGKFLAITNINLTEWAGHLLKIKVSEPYLSCLTLKVYGTITYPFNMTIFQETIKKIKTTQSPITTKIKTLSLVTTSKVNHTKGHTPKVSTTPISHNKTVIATTKSHWNSTTTLSTATVHHSTTKRKGSSTSQKVRTRLSTTNFTLGTNYTKTTQSASTMPTHQSKTGMTASKGRWNITATQPATMKPTYTQLKITTLRKHTIKTKTYNGTTLSPLTTESHHKPTTTDYHTTTTTATTTASSTTLQVKTRQPTKNYTVPTKHPKTTEPSTVTTRFSSSTSQTEKKLNTTIASGSAIPYTSDNHDLSLVIYIGAGIGLLIVISGFILIYHKRKQKGEPVGKSITYRNSVMRKEGESGLHEPVDMSAQPSPNISIQDDRF